MNQTHKNVPVTKMKKEKVLSQKNLNPPLILFLMALQHYTFLSALCYPPAKREE
jgi:hypothetical protein